MRRRVGHRSFQALRFGENEETAHRTNGAHRGGRQLKSMGMRAWAIATVLLTASVAGAVDLALGPLKLHPTFDGEDLLAIGPVKLHPHFEFAVTANDNVYIGPDYRVHQGVPAS